MPAGGLACLLAALAVTGCGGAQAPSNAQQVTQALRLYLRAQTNGDEGSACALRAHRRRPAAADRGCGSRGQGCAAGASVVSGRGRSRPSGGRLRVPARAEQRSSRARPGSRCACERRCDRRQTVRTSTRLTAEDRRGMENRWRPGARALARFSPGGARCSGFLVVLFSGRARRAKTSRSSSRRSVMMPSTPRSSSSFIVSASLIVHTCTGRPVRCAAAMNRLVTIVMGPRRTGTWMQSAPKRGIAPELASSRASATACGPIDVHPRPRPSARIRRSRRSENEPMHTRPQPSR